MVNGIERLIEQTQSPLQLFKGPELLIKDRPLTDGVLYFATDSKKIYLDCDFTDSQQNVWHDRLAFGGSSGIFFSQKEFSETDTDFNFYFNEIENVMEFNQTTGNFDVVNAPKVDDIILDEANGTFYRVTEVNSDMLLVVTSKLVVAGGGGGEGSGGGGGSGSGGFFAQLLDRTIAFSENQENMFVRYVAYAPSAIVGYQPQIDIEVYDRTTSTKLFTIENIVTSANRTEVTSTDIKPHIEAQLANGTLESNRLYSNLGFIFTDGTNRSAIQPITSFAIVSLSLTPETTNLNDYSTDAIYGVVPHYNSALIRRLIIEYTVRDQSYGTIYQDGIIDSNGISNNTAAQVTLNYQAGRPVTITTVLKGYVNNTILVQSASLEQSLMFIDPSSPIPRIVVLSWPNQSTYEAYTQDAIVRYRVTYGSSSVTSLDGHLYMYKQIPNGQWELYYDAATTFSLGQNLEWSVPFEEEGVYKLTIQVGAGASRQEANSPTNYTVSGSSSTVPVVAGGAQFDFTPDRNESASDKEHWSTIWYNPAGRMGADGRTSIIGNTEISAELENFNWTTNGWMSVPNTNRNKIVLNNGAKLSFPIAPFYGEFNALSGSYNGAIATGKTIEFDVKISNVRDRKKRIIDCSCYDITDGTYVDKEPYVGVVATGDYFVLTTTQLNILHDMTTEGMVDDTVNGLVAYYSTDERVHICYVIARSDANIDARTPANYIYTYVNGVLSGVVERNESVNFRQQEAGDNFIVRTIFDSQYADIELYNFRFYGKALSSEAVLDNYLAGLGNVTIATERKAANNITEYYNDPEDSSRNYSYIDLAKVIQSASIPYLVLRGGYRCDKKGTKMTQAEEGAEVSLPYFDKKDYRYMEAYFVDPDDETRCFGISNIQKNAAGKITGFTSDSSDRWKVLIYPQGTSSLEYPVKNLRMKTINKKQKYQLFPNTPPCQLFTFKADYMDSSMAHNTGTANQLNDLYNSAGIELDPVKQLKNTNNPYASYDLLTGVKGRPCVIFYAHAGIKPGTEYTGTDLYSNYEYIGRYNFNFDKGEPALFGFFSDTENSYGIVMAGNGASTPYAPGFEAVLKDDSEVYDDTKHYYKYPILVNGEPDPSQEWLPTAAAETAEAKNVQFSTWLSSYPLYTYKDGTEPRNSIQCWEMKNNNNHFTSFRYPFDDAADRLSVDKKGNPTPYAAWIAGYESRYPEYYSEGASDKRAFSAFLNWLASTNLMTATNEPITPVTYGDVTYTTDSPAYRLDKFKHEASAHLKLNFTAFYYIITELEILMDNRAKNMMMVSYDADNETGTGHWYPIFYDMDTAMGVNNTGKLVYRYDKEDTEFGVFNTTADYPRQDGVTNVNTIEGIDYTKTALEYSVLWANFRLCFAQGYGSTDIISEDRCEVGPLYRKMRQGNLNLNFLLNTYNNKLANAWNETFINCDSWYKYIRPKDEPNWKYDSKGNHELIDPNGSATDPNNWQLRDTNYADLLYAAQGTRSEHRKQWLKRRLLLLDGKYAADKTAFKFNFRANTLARSADTANDMSYDFVMTADDTSYVWLNMKANSLTVGAPYGPIYIPEGTTVTTHIASGDMPAGEQEATIMFGPNIVNYGEMGRLGLANVRTENSTGVENLQFKLRHFSSKLNEYQQTTRNNTVTRNPWSSFVGSYYPLLETLDLDYMHGEMNTADLRANTYLRSFTAQHSSLRTITFPSGGVLATVKVPETLTGLTIINQPLLTSVTCDNDSWAALTSLNIQGCPRFDSKAIFKIGKNKTTNKINSIDLRDIDWELDPTDPLECTLNEDETMIIDFPILNQLITTGGNESSAPWQESTQTLLGVRYHVGGHIHINNGTNNDAKHYGMDAVAMQEKYMSCYPNLSITYDDNSDVTSSFTVNYYDSNKAIVPLYTKQYAMSRVPSLTVNDLFSHLNLAYFGKQAETTHTYELVGFKISSDDSTDLFSETTKYETPIRSYENAFESARAVADIYVTAHWTTIDDTMTYDSSKTYYKMESLHVLGNSDYIWTPSTEDTQAEFLEYLATNSLYTFDSVDYVFRDGFTITADNDHKSISFYPIYVAKVRRYRVKFFDSDDVETAKVIKSEIVRYQDSATLPEALPIKTVLNPNDKTITMVHLTERFADPNSGSWEDVRADQFQYPVFGVGHDIREYPADESYFDEDTFTFQDSSFTNNTYTGVIITLKDTYNQEAITIPTVYNGRPVVGFASEKRSKGLIQSQIDALNAETDAEQILALTKEKENTVDIKRVYFERSNEHGNQIQLIKYGAFSKNTSLEYIELEACSNLAVISVALTQLASTQISRDQGTFSGCTNLTIGSLPTELSIIGPACFANCENLSLSYLPMSIRQYGQYAFQNCTHLTNVSIGDDPLVQRIEQRAFFGCVNLQFQEREAPFRSLTTIGSYAFAQCANLRILENENNTAPNLTTIERNAFQQCSSLRLAIFPTALTTIGAYAFSGVTAMGAGATTLPVTLTTIESNAFQNVSFLNNNLSGGVDINVNDVAHNINASAFSGAKISQFTLMINGDAALDPSTLRSEDSWWKDAPWGATKQDGTETATLWNKGDKGGSF